MNDFPIIEYIDPGLEELLGRFFELSRMDLDMMRAAADKRDFDTLVRLGHTVRGTGHGYGFTGLGELGGAIEQAALGRDLDVLNSHMDRMDQYLSTVRIEFIEE